MNETYFREIVDKYFASAVLNSLSDAEKKDFLFRAMLNPQFSTDLTWSNIATDGAVVSADVVSMESSLPLKKRPVIKGASGDVPKIGMKLRMGEKTITDLQLLALKQTPLNEVAARVLEHVERVVKGIEIKKEIMLLQGLSMGAFEIADEQGLGVRVGYGLPAENQITAKTDWSTPATATPFDDIQTVIDTASEKGRGFGVMLIDSKTLTHLRASQNFKNAFYAGVVTDASKAPNPSVAQAIEYLQGYFGIQVVEVKASKLLVENKDGKQVPAKAWSEGAVTFLNSMKVGRLVYGQLAEETNPVAGVVYQKRDQGTLVSKFSKVDPLEEFTAGQALALPVLDNVEGIYILNTKVTKAYSADEVSEEVVDEVSEEVVDEVSEDVAPKKSSKK